MTYGKRLRELRKEKRLTLRELSEKLHIAYSTIATIERCEQGISIEQLDLFSKFFDVSTDYILCKTDERKPIDTPQPIVLDPSVVNFAFYNQRGVVSDEQKKLVEDFIKMITKNGADNE